MKPPFFSIVIPTYNRAAFLPVAIKSVLEQTFSDWELIIVDDGSTDNTKEVVTSYGEERIKYLYQTNGERSAARNHGIRKSDGRYICFLDSDDYYLKNHLEDLHQSMAGSGFPEAVFITDVVREEHGKLTHVPHERIDAHINNICYILCSTETVIPARVSIHSNILKHFQFSISLKVSEDSELLSRIGAVYPFIEVPRHTVVYHLHDDNTTNRAKNPFPDQLVALTMIFDNPDFKPLIPSDIKKSKIAKCYYGMAQYYQLKGQPRMIIRMLIKSIAVNPFSATTKIKLRLILRYLPASFM